MASIFVCVILPIRIYMALRRLDTAERSSFGSPRSSLTYASATIEAYEDCWLFRVAGEVHEPAGGVDMVRFIWPGRAHGWDLGWGFRQSSGGQTAYSGARDHAATGFVAVYCLCLLW